MDRHQVEEDQEHDREEHEAHVEQHEIQDVEDRDPAEEDQAPEGAAHEQDERESGLHHERGDPEGGEHIRHLRELEREGVVEGLPFVIESPNGRASDQDFLQSTAQERRQARDAQLRDHGPEIERDRVELHRLDRPARLPLLDATLDGARAFVEGAHAAAFRDQQEDQDLHGHEKAGIARVRARGASGSARRAARDPS
ncbi:hypothetical protein K2X89_10665 [Myxococcota bacterium]|nr:hypothetical protein [Myxococcota bacterium]